MGIYNKHTIERCKYNNADPERQLLLEDIYTSNHSLFGLFKWSFKKDYYAEMVDDKRNKGVGFK